jgi:hypothetical protein
VDGSHRWRDLISLRQIGSGEIVVALDLVSEALLHGALIDGSRIG